MSGQTGAEILRRIVRPPTPPPVALTPARALRLAMVRAAERSVGLAVSVLDVVEDEGSLDDLLARLDAGLMLLSLTDGASGPALGLIGLDAQARAAIIEAQTLGRVAEVGPAVRAVTAADAAIARPLLDAFLREVAASSGGTPLENWVGEATPGARLPGAREAAMLLADGRYRVVRLKLDVGAGGRQGLLLAMIRLLDAPISQPAVAAQSWPARLSLQVMRAQAPIEAVLHRMRLPLDKVESFAPGQVLPLAGVSTGSVRIEGPGGCDLGAARLGQVGGMRAIRIETPLSPTLADLRPGRHDGD